MSDQNESLPIRSEVDGTDRRVHVKIVDFATPAATDAQAQVSEKLIHIRNFGQDPAGIKRQQRLSENGEMAIDGEYNATTNTNPANIGLVTQDRNAAAADSRQIMKPTAKRGTTAVDTVSLDISLHDQNGNPYTTLNPMPTYVVESEPGTEIVDYKMAPSVGIGLTDNHDYVAVASTTYDHVVAASSARIKVEVQVNTAATPATFTTKYVGFNSVADPMVVIPLKRLVTPTGVTIRVVVTNRDLAIVDIYSTIVGVAL